MMVSIRRPEYIATAQFDHTFRAKSMNGVLLLDIVSYHGNTCKIKSIQKSIKKVSRFARATRLLENSHSFKFFFSLYLLQSQFTDTHYFLGKPIPVVTVDLSVVYQQRKDKIRPFRNGRPCPTLCRPTGDTQIFTALYTDVFAWGLKSSLLSLYIFDYLSAHALTMTTDAYHETIQID